MKEKDDIVIKVLNDRGCMTAKEISAYANEFITEI